MMRLFRRTLASLAFLCLASTKVDAGERVQIKGTYSGVDKSQYLTIGDNHTIVSVVDEGLGYVLDTPRTTTFQCNMRRAYAVARWSSGMVAPPATVIVCGRIPAVGNGSFDGNWIQT